MFEIKKALLLMLLFASAQGHASINPQGKATVQEIGRDLGIYIEGLAAKKIFDSLRVDSLIVEKEGEYKIGKNILCIKTQDKKQIVAVAYHCSMGLGQNGQFEAE